MALVLNDPARVNLVLDQGSAYYGAYNWVQNGEPVNLRDYIPSAQIRTAPGGRLIADLTPFLFIDDETFLISLNLPATITAKIDRDGVWDLFLTNIYDAGDAVRLLAGSVTTRLSVTRD